MAPYGAGMASGLERAADHVGRLTAESTDLVTLWQSVTEVLERAVPHYWTPCWYTLDPASLLMTSHFHDGLPEFPREWLTEEYYTEDVNKLAEVARSAPGISTLHEATDGDPTRSPRWHENMKMGGDQELILALRTRSGDVWGALGLYREPGRPMFDAAEKRFLLTVAPQLAEGARRALLIGEATDPEGPDAPGLVILGERWQVESVTPGVEHRLAELPDGDLQAGRLPSAVLSVAAEAATGGGAAAVARVRTRSGSWVVLHGAPLSSTGGRRVAVIIEPARPARIAPLLMAAYGLTDREREVTSLVLQGASTVEVAETLTLSTHTVQQHLKAVFDKTGVRSRRDLVGKVFFAHYEPRLRDNEHRVAHDKPVRGGPATTTTPTQEPVEPA
jgi:DNA-binding CsgD family transcriptional regulator